jgi:RNA polymerase sigma-70 factor (ECF subfamily)
LTVCIYTRANDLLYSLHQVYSRVTETDYRRVENNAQPSDEQLVVRVQKGDKRAFDLLVLKYQQKVHSIVGRFVRDTDEVADVVQESFIKAYRAIPNFRGDSQFYTWLYRIAVNTAKNYLVSRSRRPPASDVDVADAEYYSGSDYLKDLGTPENNLFRDELEAVIVKAIADLPEDLRTAVTLREYEGLSYEGISDIMDCPVGTIRSRIFRARESIDAHVLKLVNTE